MLLSAQSRLSIRPWTRLDCARKNVGADVEGRRLGHDISRGDGLIAERRGNDVLREADIRHAWRRSGWNRLAKQDKSNCGPDKLRFDHHESYPPLKAPGRCIILSLTAKG